MRLLCTPWSTAFFAFRALSLDFAGTPGLPFPPSAIFFTGFDVIGFTPAGFGISFPLGLAASLLFGGAGSLAFDVSFGVSLGFDAFVSTVFSSKQHNQHADA